MLISRNPMIMTLEIGGQREFCSQKAVEHDHRLSVPWAMSSIVSALWGVLHLPIKNQQPNVWGLLHLSKRREKGDLAI